MRKCELLEDLTTLMRFNPPMSPESAVRSGFFAKILRNLRSQQDRQQSDGVVKTC